jgi:hypothetical protein
MRGGARTLSSVLTVVCYAAAVLPMAAGLVPGTNVRAVQPQTFVKTLKALQNSTAVRLPVFPPPPAGYASS